MTKSAAKVSLITMFSRVLGYIRDAVSAALLGVGAVSDAFFVAFRIPNMLRSLLAEGALSTAFVPVFTDYLEKKEKKDVWRLVSNVLSLLSVVLVFITLLGVLFAEPIVRVLAPGFHNDPEKFRLTVELTRWLFPFILFVSIAALFMGILNSMKKFSMPAFAPVVLNISMIFAGVVICPALGDTPEKQVWGWVIGALVGAVLEIVIQWIPAVKNGFSFKPVLDFAEEGMKRIMKLMAPSVVAQSVTQFNLLVNTVLASFLVQGAVTYLYYGNRLMQLPFGVFGVAIATVSFPYIAQCVSRGDKEGLCSTIHSSLKQAFFIVIPASAGIIALSGPINALLFRYGRFTAEDAAATAVVSIIYSSAIFAFSGIKILTQVFYAIDKAAAAVKISVAAVVLNIILSIALMFPFNYLGLAAATSLSGIFQFLLLYIYAEKYAGRIMTKQLLVFSAKVTAASVLMAGFVAVFFTFAAPVVNAQGSRLANGLLVFACIAAGAGLYFAAAKVMKLAEADSFVRMLKIKTSGK